MTPRELIETAQYLNPEKLESNPAEALQDAYTYSEALRTLNMAAGIDVDKIAQTLARARKRQAKPAPAPSKNDSAKSLIAELKHHYEHGPHVTREIANAIGVSGSTVALWLKGKTKPTAEKLPAIRAFLDQQKQNP